MPPEFLIDRSLGRTTIAAGLRSAGWSVTTLFEIYGSAEESVADVDWLQLAAERDFVVLSKDKRIRKRPHELEAIMRLGVRAFVLTSGQLNGAEQVARYVDNEGRILAACEAPGRSSTPFIAIGSKRSRSVSREGPRHWPGTTPARAAGAARSAH